MRDRQLLTVDEAEFIAQLSGSLRRSTRSWLNGKRTFLTRCGKVTQKAPMWGGQSKCDCPTEGAELLKWESNCDIIMKDTSSKPTSVFAVYDIVNGASNVKRRKWLFWLLLPVGLVFGNCQVIPESCLTSSYNRPLQSRLCQVRSNRRSR
jgi:hypothetical protein